MLNYGETASDIDVLKAISQHYCAGNTATLYNVSDLFLLKYHLRVDQIELSRQLDRLEHEGYISSRGFSSSHLTPFEKNYILKQKGLEYLQSIGVAVKRLHEVETLTPAHTEAIMRAIRSESQRMNYAYKYDIAEIDNITLPTLQISIYLSKDLLRFDLLLDDGNSDCNHLASKIKSLAKQDVLLVVVCLDPFRMRYIKRILWRFAHKEQSRRVAFCFLPEFTENAFWGTVFTSVRETTLRLKGEWSQSPNLKRIYQWMPMCLLKNNR